MSLSPRLPHLTSAPGRYGLPSVATVLAVLALACAFASSACAAGDGQIKGTVTSAFTAEGVEGIEVCAYTETAVEGGALEEGFFAECATTSTNGEYTVTGLPAGKYEVEFSVPAKSELNYITQYYNGSSSPAGAEQVTVTGDETISGIDAKLDEGGWITGRVTDALTTDPIEGIEVCAFSKHTFGGHCATTNSEGKYEVASLASGEFVVEFSSPFGGALDYIPQYYDNMTSSAGASEVPVTVEEETSGIDAQLTEGGQIAGRVTDASTSAAVNGLFVCAFPAGSETEIAGCALTGANGEYTMKGLPGGQYRVGFNGGTTYITQYYNNQYALSEAQAIAVVAKSVVSGINAAMEHGPAKAPKNVGLPVVSGAPAVGDTLSCLSGSWSGTPAPTFTYQWLIGGTPIPGATASTYPVQGADEGHSLACEVTAKNFVKSTSALSVAVPIPVAPPPPAKIASPTPVVTIASSKLALSGQAKSLRVKLECSDATCKGSVELTVKVLTKRRKGKKAMSRMSTLVLAKGSFSLAAGKSATVTLNLTAMGRKLLAHAERHPLPAKLVLSLAGGKTTTKSVRVS
jgi:Carboxypeptidase regulatory-like domain